MACEAPDVSSAIGFFDGFDGKLVAIVYGSLIGFSILFQVARYYWNKRNAKDDGSDPTEESDERLENDAKNGKKMKNINESSSMVANSPNQRLIESRDYKED